MSPDKLIHMANQIATFFTTKPEAEALQGIAEHINAYWEPRMRLQMFALLDAGGAGFHPLFVAAAKGIRRPTAEAA
jgi:formate dehydrogenase subunit delta